MILYHSERTVHFICVQIRLCLFLGFSDLTLVGGMLLLVLHRLHRLSKSWQIQEHLQHFGWCCSHCSCDHNTCNPLQTFKLVPSQNNVYSISQRDGHICDLRDCYTFIEPQCHLGRKSPGSAIKCIAQLPGP